MIIPNLLYMFLIILIIFTRIHYEYRIVLRLCPFKLRQHRSSVKVIPEAYLHVPQTWAFIIHLIYQYYPTLLLATFTIFTFQKLLRHVYVTFLIIICYQRHLFQPVYLNHDFVDIVYNKLFEKWVLGLVLLVVHHDVHVVSRADLAELELQVVLLGWFVIESVVCILNIVLECLIFILVGLGRYFGLSLNLGCFFLFLLILLALILLFFRLFGLQACFLGLYWLSWNVYGCFIRLLILQLEAF